MKQQCTERARKVLDGGMDIYAGSGICLGDNNFIEKFYRSAPIGITVEGSNTLTRSLIIFGQGLNKSHPYIGNIVTSIQENNMDSFTINIKNMINHTIIRYFESLTSYTGTNNQYKKFDSLCSNFANMTNIVSLMGGQLKKEQIISGHMADIFSNIYLGHALKYTFDKNNLDKQTESICIKMLNNEILDSIENVTNLLPTHLKVLIIGHTNTKKSYITQTEIDYISTIIWDNKHLNSYIEDKISISKDDILDKIRNCNLSHDKTLLNDIVQVGEF